MPLGFLLFLFFASSALPENAKIPKASLNELSLQVAGQTQKTLTKSLSQYIAKALKPKLRKRLYAQAENPPGSSPFFEKRLHHKTQTNPSPPCHINRECLNQLHNKLLNKKDEDSIHFNCQWAYRNNHLCCKDPTGCFLSYATDEIKEELDDKLKTLVVSQACSQEGISSLNSFLSDFQGDFCEKGVRHCKEFCEHTLRDFQQSFRACFSIKKSVSIDEALRRARQDPLCHREMSKVSQIYKELSFDSLSGFYKNLKWESLLSFREDLSFEDFVDCERVREGKGDESFKSSAFSMCQMAGTIESGRKLLARAKANREGSEEEENSEENSNDEDSHPVSATSGNFAGGVYQPSALVPTPTKIFPDEGKGLLEEDKKDLSRRELSSVKEPSLKEPLLKSPASSVLEKGLSSTKAIVGKTQESSQSNPQSIKNPQSINKAKAPFPPQAVNSLGSGAKIPEGAYKAPSYEDYLGGRSPSSKISSSEKAWRELFEDSPLSKEPQGFFEKTEDFWFHFVGKPRQYFSKLWFSKLRGGPQVVYQMLFQSVSAPQLEPLFVQEHQKYLPQPVFKSYDLLRGKPAGLLVEIKYKLPKLCLQLRGPKKCFPKREFKLKLQVKEDKNIPTFCHSVSKEEGRLVIEADDKNEEPCFFNSEEFFSSRDSHKVHKNSSQDFFEGSVFKLIEFPTRFIEPVDLKEYIDIGELTNISYPFNVLLSFSGFNDRVVKDIDGENSHVPVRINIVELKKAFLPDMSILRSMRNGERATPGKSILKLFRAREKEIILPNMSVLENRVSWKKGLGNCEDNVEAYFKTKLSSANIFCVNALDLLPLKIGWTRIKGAEGVEKIVGVKGTKEAERIKRAEENHKRCILSEEEAEINAKIPNWGESSKNGYKMTDLEKVQAFASSEEIRIFVPTVFPIAEISSEVLRTTVGKDFVIGSCDTYTTAQEYSSFQKDSVPDLDFCREIYVHPKLYHRYQTYGLLNDLQLLEDERFKGDFSKLIVVVPRDYFVYHGIQREGEHEPEVYGWTPLPHFKQTTGGVFVLFWLGFSWRNYFYSGGSVGSRGFKP